MKNIFISILFVFTIGLNAQPYIVIDSIRPSTPCINDSVKMYLKTVGTWTANTGNFITAQTEPTQTSFVIMNITYQSLLNNNFVYKLKVKMAWFQPNATTQIAIPQYGNPFTGNYNFVTGNCFAGIEQINSIEQLISTEYFNLLGQPISETNGITVEIKTYLGGCREVRKIFTSAQ